MSNLGDLLDLELDDLQDMPANVVYPAGAHICTLEFESKDVSGKKAVILHLVAVETQELVDDQTDTPLVPGTETDVMYMLDNEYGQGSLKDVIKPLAAATGVTNVGQLFEAVKGMQALVVTSIRVNSKDKSQTYTNVKSITLL